MEATAAPRSLAVATIRRSTGSRASAGPRPGWCGRPKILETPGGKAAHVMMVGRQLGAEVELLATVGGRAASSSSSC